MNQGDDVNESDKQKEHCKPIKGVGVAVSIGAIIAWLLGVSMNGVFNFFVDHPGIQLYPFCFALWGGVAYITWQLILRHSNLPWLFMVGAVICVAVFVATTKAVEKKLAEIKIKNSLSKPGSPPPAFAVTQRGGILDVSDGDEHCRFWFVHRAMIDKSHPVAEVKSPFHMLTPLRITNLRDVPLEIESYSIEYRIQSKWKTCRSIDVRGGAVFWRNELADFKDTFAFDFRSNDLTSILAVPIAPHHTVEGWAFFDNCMLGPDAWFRVRDMAGEEFQAKIAIPTNDLLDVPVQPGLGIKPIKGMDISAYPIMRYTNSLHVP